jgi:hypothetical protein
MICTLIIIYQVFSPTKTIFAGIGVLLLVSDPINFSIQAVDDTSTSDFRPQKM